MGAILLNNQLNAETLDQAKKEVHGYLRKREKFTLVVNSSGGDIEATFDFIDFLNESRRIDLVEEVKIYNSGSAATFLVLSIPSRRTMFWKSKLGIHLGCVTKLEFHELGPKGQIPADHFARLNAYYDRLMKLIVVQRVLSDYEMREILILKGHMEITSKDCLRRRVVQSLF